jgi:3-isopropylmalate dehydratase small subunit
MQPFERISGPAAPLLRDDVNTDQIAPAIQLWNPDYGAMLFARWRARPDGSEDPEFVLNRPPFRRAQVLVAGDNFGCGSSRESAVWCLQGFGIRAVVARSFADIFRENVLKNGLLPVTLAPGDAAAFEAAVVADDGRSPCTIDLVSQTVSGPGPTSYRFEIAAAERDALLKGLDDIGMTLEQSDAIAAWEARSAREHPWLQAIPNAGLVGR